MPGVRLSSLACGVVAGWMLAAPPPAGAAEVKPLRTFDVEEYRVEGNSVLPDATVEDAVYPFLGEARSANDIESARAALEADVDLLLVDDFSLGLLREAVALTKAHRASGGKTVIEYSGNATLDNLRAIAETGVDRIAIGALTKHLRAVDISMRFGG